MLSAAEAESLIFSLVPHLESHLDWETLDLSQANQRILATEVYSPLDFPHWDNSAMDGYAVRFSDTASASVETPVGLNIIEDIPAGYQPQQTVQAGQAARIFTGSMMPAGADSIVIQENTQRQGQVVTIFQAPTAGAFIRKRGSYLQAQTQLFAPGVVLAAPDLAVLAAMHCHSIAVYRRPRVAVLSTGSELIPVGQSLQSLQPGQIVDSNQVAIAALVQDSGAEVIRLGIVPDDREALKTALQTAIAEADVVISSGGVSVGDYDYVDEVLAELGAEIHIRKIAVKPGKPLTVATVPCSSQRSRLYFGLPGNPVSALMTFWRFVQPALRKLAGQSQGYQPQFLSAVTRNAMKSNSQHESYLWGKLSCDNGQLIFELAAGTHQSGNLINLAQTNAFAVLPVGTTEYAVGSVVNVFPVGGHGNPIR